MRFDHVTFQRQKRTRLLRVRLWGFPKMDSQGKFDGLVHRLQQAFSPRFSCHGAAQLALCYRPKALLQEHRRLENRPALASPCSFARLFGLASGDLDAALRLVGDSEVIVFMKGLH